MMLNGKFHSFVGYNYNMFKSDVNRKIHKLANFFKNQISMKLSGFYFHPIYAIIIKLLNIDVNRKMHKV